MALSYGPARALEYNRRRGFRAWVDCDDRYGRNFCFTRCNAHKRVQLLRKTTLYGVKTVDAPLQERRNSQKKIIVLISVIGNLLKMDNLLSRSFIYLFWDYFLIIIKIGSLKYYCFIDLFGYIFLVGHEGFTAF
jgi:hypothetical protein